MRHMSSCHLALILMACWLGALLLHLVDDLLECTAIVVRVLGRDGEIGAVHDLLETFEGPTREQVLGGGRPATASPVGSHAFAPLVLMEGARGLTLLLLMSLRGRRADWWLLLQAAHLRNVRGARLVV